MIENTLQEIFRDLFDDETIIITPELTADDIDDWDSLMHIQLIVEIEKGFNIKFTIGEIAHLKNVGELIDIIRQKTA